MAFDAYQFQLHFRDNRPPDPGSTYHSIYMNEMVPFPQRDPERWHGLRNMFSEKPRMPHQRALRNFDGTIVQYFDAKDWVSDYSKNIGNYTAEEMRAARRENIFVEIAKNAQRKKDEEMHRRKAARKTVTENDRGQKNGHARTSSSTSRLGAEVDSSSGCKHRSTSTNGQPSHRRRRSK